MPMAGPNALRPCAGRLLKACSPARPSLTSQATTTTTTPRLRIVAAAAAVASSSSPSCSPSSRLFSTTSPQRKRKTKDANKSRGVSSLYGSGPREHLSMSDIPLPKPRDFKPEVPVDPTHGLWGFFPAPGTLLATPKETGEHGRAWSVEELRRKSWEDLHALWWVCCRERNMIATARAELLRSKLGFGEREYDEREEQVVKTQRAVKHALTERMYTWQDAVDVAMTDPEINLEGGDGAVYTPSAYEDELEIERGWAKEDAEAAETTRAEASPAAAVTEAQASKTDKDATR